ncbi:MAG TPA: GNAT family N-acetyltransferase [Candidatus Limnocylindrales bacterium]|nr:GNAT family N-acetyltransferase [Candidatus Limnocylindrales bacterium]
MTTHAPDAEPACPGSPGATPTTTSPDAAAAAALRIERRAFDDVPRATWDALTARNPWATPFSSWAFQRAWWDAYHASAHDQTLVVTATAGTAGGAEAGDPVAIVPLMHRHEVEPEDAETATRLRHGDPTPLTPVPPTAKAIFFGASYHADYATILASPADLPAVADALANYLADDASGEDPDHPAPWDAVDLRRLRCGDPTADALAAAFGRREMSEGWTLNLEREDVCPVVHLPDGIDFEGFLSTLEKKARHEIRRKIRRAEAAGELLFSPSTDPRVDLEAFIELHQRKWGAAGLFPPTPGGDASRVFIRRLFEASGPDGPVRLSFLTVDGRRIAAGIHVDHGDTVMFYNAGVDPDARDLSPGVVLAAMYVQTAIESGKRRFDFLRGDEPYKYEWGATDEPIQRLLVRRGDAASGSR